MVISIWDDEYGISVHSKYQTTKENISEILKGSIPFMVMMVICIIILCIFPEIVTWLPDKLMGKPIGF